MFALDQNGKILKGTEVYGETVYEEFTHEGNEEIWLNQHRARFVDGEWVLEDWGPGPPPDPQPTPEQEIAALKAELAETKVQLAIAKDIAAETSILTEMLLETLVDKGVI